MVKSLWTFMQHQCQLQHGVPGAHFYIYLWKESDVASFPIPYFFDGHDHQKNSLRITIRVIYTFFWLESFLSRIKTNLPGHYIDPERFSKKGRWCLLRSLANLS